MSAQAEWVEHQVKIQTTAISPEMLVARGFKALGRQIQEDTFLGVETGTQRVRNVGGDLVVLTTKKICLPQNGCNVEERLICLREFSRMKNAQGVICQVKKQRDCFGRDSVSVYLDSVYHLGQFVEINARSEDQLQSVIRELGLEQEPAIRRSYMQLALEAKLPFYIKAVQRFHRKVGEMTFGIVSGVLTALGMLVGMNTATESRFAVIISLAVMGIVDSLSDAYGSFMSKSSDNAGPAESFRFAFGTFLGKLSMSALFSLPFLLIGSLDLAVVIDVVCGLAILAILSAEQAIATQESVRRSVAIKTIFGTVIVIVSYFFGKIAAPIVAVWIS